MIAALTDRRAITHPTLGPCWLCRNKPDNWGYCRIRVAEKSVPAHRWAYTVFVGPIPDDLDVDHLCRNPRCMRPAHLEAVTRAENNRRRSAAKTHCPRGHSYDDVNTYRRPDGARDCRVCINERSRKRNRRRWQRTKQAR